MNKITFFVLLAVWVVPELALSIWKRAKSGAQDRSSLGILWLVNTVAAWAGVSLIPVLPGWALPGRHLFFWIGVGLMVAGTVIRWYAILWLGRFFTVNVAIAADHRVIDTGPYRWVRHPSYTGGQLVVLGFSLCLGNAASLAVIFVPIFTVCCWRMRIEEAALSGALGDPYRNYMRRTWRLIPWIY